VKDGADVTVNVLLFAAAKDLAGTSAAKLNLSEDASVEEVRAALVDAFPRLEHLAASLLIAVNSQYAVNSQRVTDNDEIACFPPVSGG